MTNVKTGILYKITSLVNGKCYVGQTCKTLDSRWSEHKYFARKGSPQAIHRAMRKYGLNAFVIEELALVPLIFLNILEEYFVMQFDSHVTGSGYNMTFGGGAFGKGEKHPLFGKKFSPEHIEKIAKAHRGSKRSIETRLKQSIAASKRKHSEETKRKMTGRKLSDEHKANLRRAWEKRKCS